MTEVEVALNRFAKQVITQARANLTRQNNNVTKGLYNSFKAEVKKSPNSFLLKIYMAYFANFLDKGVRGSDPTKVKNGKQKAPFSPYSFRDKMPPMQPLAEWAKRKNIRFRNEKGQFAKGNYNTIGFWLQKRIFYQGLKPTNFWSTPYVNAFKNLPTKIVNAYALDIADFKKFINKR